MAYIKKYNNGGLAQIYVNGINVSSDPNAKKRLENAFKDNPLILDFLNNEDNVIEFIQGLDGNVSMSKIPLENRLHNRKAKKEKEEIKSIFWPIVSTLNKYNPPKTISSIGPDINLQYDWKDRGLETEEGLLLGGDDQFAALERLRKLYDFYKNIDTYDEIEGWGAFNNDKESVKRYIKTYFINDDETGIKDDLLNALKEGANYKLFKKYKDILSSVGIEYEYTPYTEDEKERIRINEDKLKDLGFRENKGIPSGIGVVNQETGNINFDAKDGIWSILSTDKNYHLNTDFVEYARKKGLNHNIFKYIKDDYENSYFLINGNLYSGSQILDGNMPANDASVFQEWIDKNKVKPYSSDIIQSYYTYNPWINIANPNKYVLGLTKMYFNSQYALGDDGTVLSHVAMLDPLSDRSKNIVYYIWDKDHQYDKWGRPIYTNKIAFDANENIVETPYYSSNPNNSTNFIKPYKYVLLGENYHLAYPFGNGKYYINNGDSPIYYNYNESEGWTTSNSLNGPRTAIANPLVEFPSNVDTSKLVFKDGGKIHKAKFGINTANLLKTKPLKNGSFYKSYDPESPFYRLHPNSLQKADLQSTIKNSDISLFPKENANFEIPSELTEPISGITEEDKKWLQDQRSQVESRLQKKNPENNNNGYDEFIKFLTDYSWSPKFSKRANLYNGLGAIADVYAAMSGKKAAESASEALRYETSPHILEQPRYSSSDIDRAENKINRIKRDEILSIPKTNDPTRSFAYRRMLEKNYLDKELDIWSARSNSFNQYNSTTASIRNQNAKNIIDNLNERNKRNAAINANKKYSNLGLIQSLNKTAQSLFSSINADRRKFDYLDFNSQKSSELSGLTDRYRTVKDGLLSRVREVYAKYNPNNDATLDSFDVWLKKEYPEVMKNLNTLDYLYQDAKSKVIGSNYDELGYVHPGKGIGNMFATPSIYENKRNDMLKKGGKMSLIDRITLENIKSYNKKNENRSKEVIKSLEKNNERLFKLILKILE